jgi:CubicO group peptidase (beta-lactamase class C family)
VRALRGHLRQAGRRFKGRVHDPIARRLGGIAGNAGLFSTAHDLARFAGMLANGGELTACASSARPR